MSDPISVEFKKDVNYFSLQSDLERLLSVVVNKLALNITQSDYSSLIITGENQYTQGIQAYSAIKLDPGIWLKIQSTDFNFDTGNTNRITGGLESSLLPLTVIASSAVEPGIIVRRDANGNFAGNTITANSIELISSVTDAPDITVNGTSLFNDTGEIVLNTKGTSDNAKNVTETIGNVSIEDILVKNVVEEYTSVIKTAANVSATINGIDIASIDNNDDSVGIFKLGENINGSDTYAKRALVSNKALSLTTNGIDTVIISNLARLDANNTFADGTIHSFDTINVNNTVAQIVSTDLLTFNDSPVATKPVTASFYVAPDTTATYAPTGTMNLNFNGYLTATKMFNAAYADYAECFKPINSLKYEDVKNKIVQITSNGEIELANKMSRNVIGIVSDNYAYLLGGTEDEVKNNSKIPVGLAGTLWVDADFDIYKANIGNFICAGYNGLASVVNITSVESVALYFGTIVGKILEIDKVNKRYRVLLVLK